MLHNMGERGIVAGDELLQERDAFIAKMDDVLESAYRLAMVILLDQARSERVVYEAAMKMWRRFQRAHGELISFRTTFLNMVVREARPASLVGRLTRRRPASTPGQKP